MTLLEGFELLVVLGGVAFAGYMLLLAIIAAGIADAAQREHLDYGGAVEPPPSYRGPCRGPCCRKRRSRDPEFTGV